jgi:RluA family pseudouridine synthase
MIPFPDIPITDELLISLRRRLRIPPGNHLLDGTLEPASELVSLIAPYEHTHRFRVKESESGLSLVELFALRFPFRDAESWQTKVESGLVGVSEKKADSNYIVHAGEVLFHRNIGVIEPSVPFEIIVIHECEMYLWIDKPAPLPMHSGGRYHRNTVVSLLEERGMGPLFIVHRLDAVTSGLVLLARNERAAASVGTMLESGQPIKTYEAVVRGNPQVDTDLITVGIKRDKGFLFKCSDAEDAKWAQTRVDVIKQGDGWAHVRCTPVTGRTHQIRLHLAHWGYPIWDDQMYNGDYQSDVRRNLRQDRAISLVSLGIQKD